MQSSRHDDDSQFVEFCLHFDVKKGKKEKKKYIVIRSLYYISYRIVYEWKVF